MIVVYLLHIPVLTSKILIAFLNHKLTLYFTFINFQPVIQTAPTTAITLEQVSVTGVVKLDIIMIPAVEPVKVHYITL